MTRVAVVTIAHGRHDHLDLQGESLRRSHRPPDDYVVVAMDDRGITTRGGPLPREVVRQPVGADGLPLAAARNAGAAAAWSRGADVAVFLDVDCLAGPDLVAAYADVVARRPQRIWSGPVTYLETPPPAGYDLAALPDLDDPHPARPAPRTGEEVDATDPALFWSLSFATARTTWSRTGGFCEDYVGYGGEDTDFARKAAVAGVGLAWVGSARAYHQFHPVEDPPTSHLADIARNATLFHRRWGDWPMQGWLDRFEEEGLIRRTRGVVEVLSPGS